MIRVSQKAKILDLLLRKKRVHMRELNNIAYRYTERVREIRKMGFDVKARRIKGSEFYYELVS